MLLTRRLSTYGLIMFATIFAAGYAITFVQAQADNNNGYVSGAEIQVPFTKNPPPIHAGSCKIEDWKTAPVTELGAYSYNGNLNFVHNAIGYLILEYDERGLYGCVDLVSQRTLSTGSFIAFNFDTGHDGWPAGNSTKDDYNLSSMIRNINANQIDLSPPFSNNNAPVGNVILVGAFSPSPNIMCDKNANCSLTNGYTSSNNLQYKFFVPLETLKSHPNLNNPNTIGFYFVTSTDIGNGFDYPRIIRSTDTMIPLADLTFLSQPVTTTYSATSTTPSISSLSIVSTTRSQSVTTQIESPKSTDWLWYGLAGFVVAGIAGLGYLTQRWKKRQEPSDQ